MDAATNWIKVCFVKDYSDNSILEAKNAFERDAMSRGVSVCGYHADNGRFAEHTFKEDCNNKLQRLTFRGVGAHHQNRISECKINS